MLFLTRLRRTMQVAVTVVVIVLFAWTSPVYSQSRKAFTINEISELLKSGVNPDRVARFVEQYGVAFELDNRTLQRLKQDGASEAVLSAVKRMSAQYTEERQVKIKEQEEATKRQRQEEAKRKEQERIRADEEKRRQAELARKKQEEAQRAEEIRQRQQEEARRKEEDLRRAEEQKRQQAEAEKVKQAEEQRRQEELRLAEERRRVEDEARRAGAERKKQEEIQARNKDAMIAKSKSEAEQRQAEAQSRMLAAMKQGQTAVPTYNDGDSWLYNVIEDYAQYDSRALKGIYELRYSDKRFQVFKGTQRVTSKEGQIGVLLVMVGQGEYMGGQYLNFPLSIGQKWNQEYQSGMRASRIVLTWSAETNVKDVESITTPAGKFWAFKIVREARSTRGNDATFTYYYSPQTKSIVKMLTEFPNDHRTVEMVKFGSGR